MESKALTIEAPQQLPMYCLRGLLLCPVRPFHLILLLSCTLLCLTACKSCSIGGLQNSAEHDACGSYSNNPSLGFQDIIVGDTASSYVLGGSASHKSDESICTNSQSFCFPSTLFGFASKEHELRTAASEISRAQSDSLSSLDSTRASKKNGSSDYGVFELLNGRAVSCSLNSKEGMPELSAIPTGGANQCHLSSCRGSLLNHRSTQFKLKKKSEMTNSDAFDVSSSLNVDISPPVLDWGENLLFFPSVAFLTVANTCNNSILHVYEPFSTNIQFYPCNFSEVVLGPGEVASICFVFLPRWLGLSSAHLILQTSLGGFLVQVKGFAIDSPYEIQSLVSMDGPFSGWLSKNLSLFNPLDETIHVEEVTAWISVSLGNTSYQTEAVCSIENFWEHRKVGLPNVEDWLVVKSGQVGFPMMALRPHSNWEIDPHRRETIIEVDFSLDSEGKIFGAFCMQLLGSSQDQSDTVMVPFEIDLSKKATKFDFVSSVSASLEALDQYDAAETVVVAISLRNSAPYILSVINIRQVAERKLFHIKYAEGLLLFPGTFTQVALITCEGMLAESYGSPQEVSNIITNCILLILTNDSSAPEVEIPCRDVFRICSESQKDSSVGFELQAERVKSGNTRTGSLGTGMQFSSQLKGFETAEADESVLQNWKSQGTSSGMSVLVDHEVLFPMVQVGTHSSKWVTVKNPSQQPVVMQLILNSGEIVDECRDQDGFMLAPTSGGFVHSESTILKRYGFLVAESAVTEAYVQPYSSASFGPIFFHPSNRCQWRSSALIRNNLSGVEWLSLRGFGGTLSMVLLERSKPVSSIEFNLDLPMPLNISPFDVLFHMEKITYACSRPLSKELYAKNVGDLPLEVRNMGVSGTECGVDGFMVHSCKGFFLEPGESKKFLVSFQTDFSAAMVHRDLELALATGILVIPLKASIPLYMLNICKKSVFWTRLKKFSVAVILVTSIMFVVLCWTFPQVMAIGSQDYFCKKEKNSICAIRGSRKSSRIHCNQRSKKFSFSPEMDCLLRSVGEEKSSNQASVRYPDSQDGAPELGITAQHAMPCLEKQRQIYNSQEILSGNASTSLLPKSENSGVVDTSRPANLSVRIAKEKGRKRRNRKGAAVGLTGLFDVSSSQSGNSTPSSPLSPITSTTSNTPWSLSPDVGQSVGVRNPFAQGSVRHCEKSQVSQSPCQAARLDDNISMKHSSNNWYVSTQQKPSSPGQSSAKPVLLPSATFPSAGRAGLRDRCTSPLASTSTIAPHARAPGSKIFNQKPVEAEEKVGIGKEYVYDIWGNHLSWLHLMDRSKDITAMNSNITENDYESFFVRGPQTFMAKPQPRYVSFFHQEG